MKKLTIVLLSCLFVSFLFAAPFEKSTPEAEGISSQAVIDFVDRVEAEVDALHSFMLIRHGKQVAQGWWAPYNATSPHVLFSLSKSFTSTAIGFAVQEGLVSLNDTVISFFPDETPAEPSDNLKNMRVRDLLAMNSGHKDDTTGRIQNAGDKTWVEAFLSLDVEFKPGTHFVYNSGASFMLSAIVQKVSGKTVLDFLTPRFFEPLEINGATWDSNPQGINVGGWGLKVKTEDIAKLGQFYLQKGMWNGKQLLSQDYIAKATSRQTSNGSVPTSDWDQGYGYQFWMCRHNLYRGDGAFGQYCIVMPEQDAVLAITSGVGDMQKPMNIVWETLLPAMEDEPLPENGTLQTELTKKSSNLALKTVAGEKSSKLAKKVSGSTFVFDDNDFGMKSVSFDFKKKQTFVKVERENGVREFTPGFDEWTTDEMPFLSNTPEPVAICGAWVESNHYQLKVAGYETPFIQTADFVFEKDNLLFDMEFNVGFGGTDRPTLKAVKK